MNKLDQQKIILKRKVDGEIEIVDEVCENYKTDCNTGNNSKHIGLVFFQGRS